MPRPSAPSRGVRVRERVIAVVTGAVAFAGWAVVVLDTSDTGMGLGLALWTGGLACGVVAATLNRTLAAVGAVSTAMWTVRRADPLRLQARLLGLPGPWIWCTPPVLAVPMFAWLPFTPEARSGDWSLAGGIVFFVVLAGGVGLLAGVIVWLLLGLPLLGLLVSLLPGHSARQRISAGATFTLLWSTALFATTLVLGAPDERVQSSRAAQGPQLLALLGLNDAIVEHPALLWVARGALVLLVLSIVTLVRVGRAMRPGVR